MTEAEWLAGTDPRRMLDYLEVYHRVARTRTGRRKLRLLACACCRRLWRLHGDQTGKQVVETVERFADGSAEWDDVLEALRAEKAAMQARGSGGPEEWWAWEAAERAARYKPQEATDESSLFVYRNAAEHWSDGPRALCSLIREVYGNPFRPSPPLPAAVLAWNGATIPRMAQAIYEERAFDRLPILADALDDAGCADEAILGHCRQPGEHARGCWALALLLGKG